MRGGWPGLGARGRDLCTVLFAAGTVPERSARGGASTSLLATRRETRASRAPAATSPGRRLHLPACPPPPGPRPDRLLAVSSTWLLLGWAMDAASATAALCFDVSSLASFNNPAAVSAWAAMWEGSVFRRSAQLLTLPGGVFCGAPRPRCEPAQQHPRQRTCASPPAARCGQPAPQGLHAERSARLRRRFRAGARCALRSTG